MVLSFPYFNGLTPAMKVYHEHLLHERMQTGRKKNEIFQGNISHNIRKQLKEVTSSPALH